MSRQSRLSPRGLSVIAVVVLVLPFVVTAQAQDEVSKGARSGRTPWGHPNLQGVWTSDSVMGVPFEKPRTEPLTAEEKALQQRLKAVEAQIDPGGSNVVWNERQLSRAIKRPASLVVDPPDGRVPITPEVKAVINDFDKDVRRYGIGISSHEDLDLWDRCITKGFPTVMMPLGYSNMYQIFQTPDYVAIIYEVIHDVRIIPLNGRPHLSPQLRQWWGDSRGHWEGDTLVVDVTNFTDKTFLKQQATGQFRGGGKDMHIVERWRVAEDGTLEYRATVTDPRSFTRPWVMGVPLVRDDEHTLLEYACHEGNYGMRNILTAAFKEQQSGKTKRASPNPR
jgi:hypothetical protein